MSETTKKNPEGNKKEGKDAEPKLGDLSKTELEELADGYQKDMQEFFELAGEIKEEKN